MFIKIKTCTLILVYLFFCFLSDLYAAKVVSLGGDCTVAGMYRQLNLRTEAYPFDWMYSTIESVYQAFEDDFKHFLDPETLKIGSDEAMVIDYYGLKFVHDFPTINDNAALNDNETHAGAKFRADWQQFITAIKEKYYRRIERLRKILTGKEPIFFIRYAVDKERWATKNDILKLRDLLSTRYPNLDFTIVAISNTQAEADWNLARIRNLSILFESKNDRDCWLELFRSIHPERNDIKYH